MQIAVKYHRTLFSKDDFSIGIYLNLENKKFITCKGIGLPKTNSFFKFNGEFQQDVKGRKVFSVISVEQCYTKSKKSIETYLMNNCSSLDKPTIKNLVKTFGFDIFKIIENNPEQLLNCKGMNQTKLDQLIVDYKKTNSLKNLVDALSKLNIAYRYIKLIYDEYDQEAINIIQQNPFILMDIDGIGFKICDTIARAYGIALDSEERIRAGILEAMSSNAIMSGNTYIIDDDLIKISHNKLCEGLNPDIISYQQIISNIAYMVNSGDIKVFDNHKMMLKKLFIEEDESAKKIGIMLRLPVLRQKELLKAINDYHDFQLNSSQLDAVRTSLANNISIVTGGAGTGKTTIEKAIINCYLKVYPNANIHLLAPSGKAARRMEEAVGNKAHTIHSLLGIYEGIKMPTNYIEDGLIIVDEFSMVSLDLLHYLMIGINCTKCKLVLVGDINQLQSVGYGSCLKDMIESNVIPTVRLTEIYRQNSSTIIDNSLKIINNQSNLVYDDSMMMVSVQNENEAITQIEKIYKYYTEIDGIDNVALISPLRRNQDGRLKCVADNLNRILQDVINSRNESNSKSFRLNDRVMMWKNTELASNGEIGTIVQLDTEGDWKFEIEWENGNTGIYNSSDMNDMTLAYAMSVHKSQGSQYKTVIIPILSCQKCQLFKNNLLYTAITRARNRVIIVGDEKAINYMIKHSDTYTRRTLFKERILSYSLIHYGGK